MNWSAKGQEIPYIRVNWAELERRSPQAVAYGHSTAVEEETYQNFLDRCRYEEGAITPLVICRIMNDMPIF